MQESVRFYFSFRSPYAWFAAERWDHELAGLDVPVERIPFFPTAETFPNDPARVPRKLAYVVQDMRRLAREFGLPLKAPPSLDTDWVLPHAGYLGVRAEQPERATPFMLELFRARFSRGQDVADAAVIADAARRAGASPDVAAAGAASEALRAEVTGNFLLGQERDGIFGTPSFCYRGQLFWGHDRMHHLRAAILKAQAPAAREVA